MIELTNKQEMFCREYIVDFNGTQSAIRAGYSKKTAQQISSRMLTNVDIQNRIKELIEARNKRTEINADAVLANLYNMAMLDIADVLNDDGSIKDVSEWSEDWRRAVGGMDVVTQIIGSDEPITIITKKIKGIDKLRAWELIGKHVDIKAWETRFDLSSNGKEVGFVVQVLDQETADEIEKLR